MRLLAFISLFSLITGFAAAQAASQELSRGSIPEELLRPKRGEAARYPIDTVIGPLGQGEASDAAFSFAAYLAEGFTSGQMSHPSLAGISSSLRESYLSALDEIQTESYRMGSGREEPDGSVSFLIRFIGKEQSITGELFIRFVTKYREPEALIEPVAEEVNAENETEIDDEAEIEVAELEDTAEPEQEAEEVQIAAVVREPVVVSRSWVLEELLLEEPRSRLEQSAHYSVRELFDFLPYERFF